jgi:hypothetical protein
LVQWPGRTDGKRDSVYDGVFATGSETDTDGDGQFTGYVSRPFGRDPKATVAITAHAWPPDGSMYGSLQATTSADKPLSTPLVVRLKEKEAPEGLVREPIVWGDPRDGIEYGLKLLGPSRRRIGEHVRFSVYARNPGESLAGVFAYRDWRVKGWVANDVIYLRQDLDSIGSGTFVFPDIHLSPKEVDHLGTGRFLLVPPDFAGDSKGEAILRLKPGKYPICFAADLNAKPDDAWGVALEVEAASDEQLREINQKYPPPVPVKAKGGDKQDRDLL